MSLSTFLSSHVINPFLPRSPFAVHFQKSFSRPTVSRLSHFNLRNWNQKYYSGIYSKTVKREDVGLIWFDNPGSKVNILSESLLSEFQACLKELNDDPQVRALVIISNKKDNFIAGTEIRLASKLRPFELSKLSKQRREIFNQLQHGKPTVAAIHGTCLGGGLEVALACHYRIASSSSKTSFGLPQLDLMLLPGTGGTARLWSLIGLTHTLDLLITKRTFPVTKANSLGLVDELVDEPFLERSAIEAAKDLLSSNMFFEQFVTRPPTVLRQIISFLQSSPFRKLFIVQKIASILRKKDPYERYPASTEILALLEPCPYSDISESKVEVSSFSRLSLTPESKALIHVYYGQKACLKNPYPSSKPIKTIGILGAGMIGAGVAQLSIQNNFDVLLKDTDSKAIYRGLTQIRNGLAAFPSRRGGPQSSKFDLIDHKITPLTNQDRNWRDHFKSVDIVIESVYENLGVKQSLLQDLEPYLSKDCIIASNTSALSLLEISSILQRPQNLVGIHYFTQVNQLPLLEIVKTSKTSTQALSKAFAVALQHGKTPIVVKDTPGFYINRCLGPFLVEVVGLLEQGVEPNLIETAMTDFGFPLGPLSLVDQIGTDVIWNTLRYLSRYIPSRIAGGVQIFEFMFEKGFLGKKTGQGFFIYRDDPDDPTQTKVVNPEVMKMLLNFAGPKVEVDKKRIQDRLLGKLINEAAYCLQEEVIEKPIDGDIGAVYGFGFPAFRGGPFQYVDRFGTMKFVQLLNELKQTYGDSFEPAPILVAYSKGHRKFFPR